MLYVTGDPSFLGSDLWCLGDTKRDLPSTGPPFGHFIKREVTVRDTEKEKGSRRGKLGGNLQIMEGWYSLVTS